MLFRVLAVTAVVLLLAQPAVPDSPPPKLHGQTLDDEAILLPDAASGKVTLLLVGASRKGGELTGVWKDHFLTDFGSNPHATYYVIALLENVSASDEIVWKRYLGMRDDSLPGVLLLDESGRPRWSYSGVYDPEHYRALKMMITAALEDP